MSSRLRTCLLTVALALIFSAHVSAAGAQEKRLAADERQLVDRVSTIFAAARVDDVAKFNPVIASDFYIFDGGARFSGDAIWRSSRANMPRTRT